ncbi:MAG: aminotransferase class IV [Nitrospinae bacterium]|nr:aminotransferase class IV [Nitrospinota bacterium]
MTATGLQYASMNGVVVPYEEASVHIQSPAVRYGSSLFEVIKGYWNARGETVHLFRLEAHLRRLAQSAHLAAYDFSPDPRALEDQIRELIRANEVREDVDVRLNLLIGGQGPIEATGPVFVGIVMIPARNLFGVSGGLHCSVSSWRRISDDVLPPRIKASANYQNSRLPLIQAKRDGYDSVILLNSSGQLTEGPGATLFLVREGEVLTPPVTAGILEGITRATLIQLFREHCGRDVMERLIDRTEIYLAEEAFFCGSGAEIRSILSVDRHPVGDGKEGPLTNQIRELYLSIARGESTLYPEWRTTVHLEPSS